jgi:hypothetical protein
VTRYIDEQRVAFGVEPVCRALARHVAERLRAICGDLRLPILDDLGAGPALAELAFFRVAQEAVSRAAPPALAPLGPTGRPPRVGCLVAAGVRTIPALRQA